VEGTEPDLSNNLVEAFELDGFSCVCGINGASTGI
jgi:hypothetical protein